VTFASTEFGYFLTLAPGEELMCCLIQFAREHELDAAVITGVGSFSELELGTGGGRDRDHRRSRLREPLETCALAGIVTLVDGEPFPHLHGSFARDDHGVIGGHVYLGVVGTALDLAVQVTARSLAGTGSCAPEHANRKAQ
jgi:uncharacterized protein